MSQQWSSEDWDGYEDWNSTSDLDWEEYYWIALNSESGGIIRPVIRKWSEWEWVNTPMTEEDLRDTMLFVKNIKER